MKKSKPNKSLRPFLETLKKGHEQPREMIEVLKSEEKSVYEASLRIKDLIV